jgi:hypothetical protein
MRRFGLIALAGAALALPLAASGSTIVTQTFKLRWPATGHKVVYVRTIHELFPSVRSVAISVNGTTVDNRADYIVDCAHRGPSFAVASWRVVKPSTIQVRISLESGLCVGGPKSAGQLATVKVAVSYR